jgi:hypothetical protein
MMGVVDQRAQGYGNVRPASEDPYGDLLIRCTATSALLAKILMAILLTTQTDSNDRF